MRNLATALLLVPLACSSAPSDDDGERVICPIGDLNGPTEISIIHRNDRFEMTDTSSGALVPAHFAIQGGFVVYASVKAKNIDGCSVIIKAVLRDICDNAIIALDERPLNLVPAQDGWGIPQAADASGYANIAACPRVVATRDIEGEPYLLEIIAEDADGRRAQASTMVVPTCLSDELQPISTNGERLATRAQCLCECDANYVVGQGCGPETGPYSCE